MEIIYKPDNENRTWTISEWDEKEPIPEGYTTIAPPKLNWRPIFDWETNEWIETATEWEKLGYTTEEEMIAGEQKKQLEASLPDDKARITQLEEMVMQLLLMS